MCVLYFENPTLVVNVPVVLRHFSCLDLSPLTDLKGFKMIKMAESGIAENLDFSAALSNTSFLCILNWF